MNASELRRSWIFLALVLSTAAGFISSRTLLAQAPADAEVEEVVVVEDDSPATAPGGEIKTVAVIASQSYTNIVADVSFIGSLADRPELGGMIEGMLAMVTQGKGLAGVDKAKPWGVILQTDGAQFLPVGCIPVTDLGQTLQIVQGFNLPVQDGADGVKSIALPNGQSIHIKESNGWAFIANSPASFEMLPDNPQAALEALIANYDLGAKITVPNVPEAYRQQAVAAMKGGMEQGLERKDGESDEDYEMRRKMAELQMQQFEQMASDIDELVVGLGVDAQQQRAFADFNYTFVPGSKTARQVTSAGQSQTNFAGFYQPDAAITMSFASKSDPEIIQENIEQMRSTMLTMRKQAEKVIEEGENIPDDETRDALKAAMHDLADAVQATMEAGEMDGSMAIEMAPGSASAVGGMLVKDTAKFESGLKKLAPVAEKQGRISNVQWDAATDGDVKFHTFTIHVPEEKAELRDALGDTVPASVGVGTGAVYVGIGEGNIDAVKQAISASKAEPNKAVPQFEFSLSLAPVMAVAAANAKGEEDQANAQKIADMLKNDAQGRDHVRMTAKLIDNGLQYRVELEEGVLRAMGKGYIMAQEKAQREAMQGVQ